MTTTANPFDEYDEKLAAKDLRRYRTKGPQPWTRALIDAIKAEGVEGASLLDIGGGIGAIHHELLDAGVAHATCVEASTAYLEAARSETERRGTTSRITFKVGDFVELAGSVPPADIVTLDRVVNSYPEAHRLVEVSADHARRLYGLVVPRNTRVVALMVHMINLVQRFRRRRVRAAVVALDDIDRVLRSKDLRLRFSQDVGPAWHVALYGRLPGPHLADPSSSGSASTNP